MMSRPLRMRVQRTTHLLLLVPDCGGGCGVAERDPSTVDERDDSVEVHEDFGVTEPDDSVLQFPGVSLKVSVQEWEISHTLRSHNDSKVCQHRRRGPSMDFRPFWILMKMMMGLPNVNRRGDYIRSQPQRSNCA